MFDIQHILSILPHRYPLLMVDRILELKPDWIVGIKNVTVNEPFFQGHFPGLPVMPGVLIIESMAQVGAVLLLTNATESGENFDDKVVLFTSIDHAKFRRPVVPGDQLRIELKVLKHKGSIWKVSARALVEGKLAAEAVLMCHVAERSSLEGPDSPASRAPAKSGESQPPMAIHPSAVIHPGARVDDSAEIGPFCVIGEDVEIGARSRLMAHIFMEGPIVVGEENLFYPYSTIGIAPQDLKYHGERSATRIGSRNLIRELVTIHRGTGGGGGLTSIGDDNLLQAYAHVAHDCQIGSNTILSHSATLGGHVTIEDHAVVGAHCGVHQFCRIGVHSYIGGYSVITQDVMPYSLVVTERGARVFGVNKIGLERRGFSKESIQALHRAFRSLTKEGLNTAQALEKIHREAGDDERLARLLRFVETSERGLVK